VIHRLGIEFVLHARATPARRHFPARPGRTPGKRAGHCQHDPPARQVV